MNTKVLIVDDNEMYRSAFRRNLMLRDYEVYEAENGDQALRVFQEHHPEVVVTDLSMRTPKEGLDVIRSIRAVEPLVPVVMISAVGTFEEGAEATRLGAHAVISKSRIDDEIESLYATIESAREIGNRQRALREEIQKLDSEESGIPEGAEKRLREIIADSKIHNSVRVEAYDVLVKLTESAARMEMASKVETISTRDLEAATATLLQELPAFPEFDEGTQKELRTAEYFFRRQGGDVAGGGIADFSRNIGFSYCFAVENEAKARLRKRLQKFLSNKETQTLVGQFIDSRTGQLDLFYHQYLARMQHMQPFDFTVDNVKQVFQRIMEHGSRYKPDGLKALGIVILCFGRTYDAKTIRKSIRIDNPLHLRGIDSEEDVSQFAYLLVSLQHYRNPYIHPEISEMEKISNIRNTAFECLKMISRIVA
ncbi:MAG: response regulator [Candidatus Sumerlaeia bacterium]|nr:response regulator [Candidatus Sumerlaeia bacterium]